MASWNFHQGHFTRVRVNVSADRIELNDLLSREFRKHGREAMEIILSPLVQGVIVAIRTFHATAHEDFRHQFRLQSCVFGQRKKGCWAMSLRITGRRDDPAGEFVIPPPLP